MVNINVKWGKEKLCVEVDQNEPPILLKSQLFAMTGVAPDRQKVVVKGRTLGDDSWNGVSLQEGALIMMMGSSAAIMETPTAQQQVSAAEAEEKKDLKLPIGLQNIGNTCYLNSVIQSFKTVPVLKAALQEFPAPPGDATAIPEARLSHALKLTFEELDKPSRTSSDAVLPFLILQNLHVVLPQFGSRGERGQLQQQDANECFTELQRIVLEVLSKRVPQGKAKVSNFFRGIYTVTLKNLESEDEPVKTFNEDFFQLSCFLSQEVKYIQTGLKDKLTEEVEKQSELLGRSCKYERKALIDRLPAYISIQMVRFFFKSNAAVNAKILKDVKFPLTLDVFDMCSARLQEKLRPQRDLAKEMDDAKLERLRAAKLEGKDGKDVDALIEKPENLLPYSFEDDEGSNNSGYYDLQAVITHKGRSSDSGHYVSWVRLEGDKWAMCDDEEVHPVTSDDVLKLSGGGDWHCAYVLVYGPKKIYKMPSKADQA